VIKADNCVTVDKLQQTVIYTWQFLPPAHVIVI